MMTALFAVAFTFPCKFLFSKTHENLGQKSWQPYRQSRCLPFASFLFRKCRANIMTTLYWQSRFLTSPWLPSSLTFYDWFWLLVFVPPPLTPLPLPPLPLPAPNLCFIYVQYRYSVWADVTPLCVTTLQYSTHTQQKSKSNPFLDLISVLNYLISSEFT